MEKQEQVVLEEGGNIAITDGTQLFFKWKNTGRVDFKELKGETEENMVRVFSIKKEGCNLQFRATQSLGSKTKARNLIATGYVSIKELELILSMMRGEEITNADAPLKRKKISLTETNSAV